MLQFVLSLTLFSPNCSRSSGFKSSLNKVHLRIYHRMGSYKLSIRRPQNAPLPADCKWFLENVSGQGRLSFGGPACGIPVENHSKKSPILNSTPQRHREKIPVPSVPSC